MWQADHVSDWMSDLNVKAFEGDKIPESEKKPRQQYGSGDNAPKMSM